MCVSKIPLLKSDNALKIQDLLQKRKKKNSGKKIMSLSDTRTAEIFHMALSAGWVFSKLLAIISQSMEQQFVARIFCQVQCLQS